MCKESKETLGKLRKVLPYSTTPIYPCTLEAEFFLGSEHGVVGSESEESVRVGDGIFEVGFHFDISSFTNNRT